MDSRERNSNNYAFAKEKHGNSRTVKVGQNKMETVMPSLGQREWFLTVEQNLCIFTTYITVKLPLTDLYLRNLHCRTYWICYSCF